MVGIATRLPVGTVRGSKPGTGKIPLSSPKRPHRLWGSQTASYSMGTGHLSWEYGSRGREVDHSPYIATVKNNISCTTTYWVSLFGESTAGLPIREFETVANQCSLTQVVGRQHKLLSQQAAARLTTRKLSRLLDTL